MYCIFVCGNLYFFGCRINLRNKNKMSTKKKSATAQQVLVSTHAIVMSRISDRVRDRPRLGSQSRYSHTRLKAGLRSDQATLFRSGRIFVYNRLWIYVAIIVAKITAARCDHRWRQVSRVIGPQVSTWPTTRILCGDQYCGVNKHSNIVIFFRWFEFLFKRFL